MDVDRIYIPLQSSTLVACARETGELLWSASVDTHWPPVAAPGVVFAATADAVRAFDATTGTERWSTPMAALSAPMTADAAGLIVTTAAGEAIALNTNDGSIVWKRNLGAVTRHPPALVAGTSIVLSLEDARVVALNRQTGEIAWQRMLEGTLSAPAVARDRILVGTTANTFYALHAERGTEAWKWRVGGDVIGAEADGDVVYFA